jgi:hypothetical protein
VLKREVKAASLSDPNSQSSSLPVNSMMKIDKKALRELASARADAGTGAGAGAAAGGAGAGRTGGTA